MTSSPERVSRQSVEPVSAAQAQSRRRIFFVVNNKSGGADEAGLRQALARHLDEEAQEAVDWKLFIRKRKGKSRRKATRRAMEEGFDTVVAVGGDGTVSKVADELQGSSCRMGIVATGTGNLIARSLGLPMDVDEAMRLIAAAPAVRHLDGMRVGKKTYFSHISMGTYSRIAKRESESQKKWLGRGAYVWNMVKELSGGRSWKFALDADGRVYRRRASLVIVANVGAAGIAGMRWGSGIRSDDGRLDLCIVSGRRLRDYANLAWNALRGRPEAGPISYLPVRSQVAIRSAATMPVRADGKVIDSGGVEVEVVRRAVPVIVADSGEVDP